MDEKKVGVGIGIMILKGNKILLGKRNDDPAKASSQLKGAGTWTMPGGKLHFSETFLQAAKRELKEETGMILKEANVICVNEDIIETAHFITIGLLSESFEGDAKPMEPDEITEWKWFDIDNLPQLLYFPSAKIIENHRKKKFYTGE